MPSAAPTTIASESPATARQSDAAALVMSSPLLTRSNQDTTTSLKGGSASVETMPVRAPISQASARMMSGEYRHSVFISPRRATLLLRHDERRHSVSLPPVGEGQGGG